MSDLSVSLIFIFSFYLWALNLFGLIDAIKEKNGVHIFYSGLGTLFASCNMLTLVIVL